ncbi:hypothetical protein [Neptunomonas marina]|uniref:DUF4760 domain-containing protein n=1 Tax=Neptunomonas marina TaxID=1815562 RepID=A0A437QC57_9GAMM|nr:hypothetical protein [Neptunomonas marina]RVU32124.1 hypothetical protein EOE65_00250 [Neptunomonas marina]
MTPAETGFVIIIVVITLAGAAFVVQSLENQRQQKRSALRALRADIRYAEQIRDGFPSELMSPQLAEFLSHYLTAQWRKLLTLDNSAAMQNAAKASVSQQPSPPTPYKAGSLTRLHDKDQALKAAAMSKELAAWLKNLANRNRQSTSTISELLKYCHYCVQQVAVDGLVFDALEYQAVKGPKPALHQFKNCLHTLERIDHRHFTDRQIYELRTYVTELEASLQDAKDPASPDNIEEQEG